MPTRQEQQAVFESLVIHGLEFIDRSLKEIEDEQKFSVVHFAVGLELLLKARLFAEHWAFIASDPKRCSWSSIRDGSVHTLQASELCAVVATVTGTSLAREKDAFNSLFLHRNRVLHFVPDAALQETAAEQCLGWYYLYKLLTGPWTEYFEFAEARLIGIDARLKYNRKYLKVRFEQVAQRLNGPASRGLLVDCPSCGYRSAVLEDAPHPGALEYSCEVCGAHGSMAFFECGHGIPVPDLPSGCECGETHDRDDLRMLVAVGRSHDDVDGEIACGECDGDDVVVATQGGYICLECGLRDETVESCDYCSHQWIGVDFAQRDWPTCGRCHGPKWLHED